MPTTESQERRAPVGRWTRLATFPGRLVGEFVRRWRAAPPLQRLVSCAVAAGFIVVLLTIFSAYETGDQPPSLLGLSLGAALLLLAAPWRWHRAGYVAVWALSILFTNNIVSANDESWNGIPGSVLVIALMTLSYWMSHREEERERDGEREPTADPLSKAPRTGA